MELVIKELKKEVMSPIVAKLRYLDPELHVSEFPSVVDPDAEEVAQIEEGV